MIKGRQILLGVIVAVLGGVGGQAHAADEPSAPGETVRMPAIRLDAPALPDVHLAAPSVDAPGPGWMDHPLRRAKSSIAAGNPFASLTSTTAASPPAPARPAAVRAVAAVAAASNASFAALVSVRATMRHSRPRLTFHIGKAASPELRTVADGVELRFAGPAMLDLSHLDLSKAGPANAIAAVEQRRDADGSVAAVKLRCACTVATGRFPGFFFVDIGPAVPVETAEAEPTATGADDDFSGLRASLASRIQQLNNPAATAKAAAPAAENVKSMAATPAVIKPSCAPDYDLSHWLGDGHFVDRLVALRRQAANASEGAPEMATLAEFYVANDMPQEALDAAATYRPEDPLPVDRTRLQRVVDIAHLLEHTAIPPGSLLLTVPAACEREDRPLWSALAAAVAGDAKTVRENSPRARAVLRDVPETLRRAFAMTIADSSGEDPDTLREMVAALRGASLHLPQDKAAWLLLQARLAHAEHSLSDELLFLTRAAAFDHTIPGLEARIRLAGLQLARAGVDPAPSEAVLLDAAHTYRYDGMGEEAALLLARARINQGDLSAALQVADDSAVAGRRAGRSEGANLAAEILRLLLVDAKGAAIPTPPARLALFWRYEGYATPGVEGDDIRLGASRLMLQQDLPEAALDVDKELAPATAARSDAVVLRAMAEARAATGDPQQALAMLSALPPSDDAHRAAASAYARLARPAEAAEALKDMTAPADRSLRATMLYLAQDWTAAASAYADLLRDPALDRQARSEASARYAFASGLAARPVLSPPSPDLLVREGATADALALDAMPSVTAASAQPAPALAVTRVSATAPAPDPVQAAKASMPGVIQPVSAPTHDVLPLTAVRHEIERSHHIERLLGP